MIWILGEYCDRIDSVDELLTTFLDNFADENSQVSIHLYTITTGVVNCSLRELMIVHLISYMPGSVAAADGHCEAVSEAPSRHPAAGTECAEPGHSGER